MDVPTPESSPPTEAPAAAVGPSRLWRVIGFLALALGGAGVAAFLLPGWVAQRLQAGVDELGLDRAEFRLDRITPTLLEISGVHLANPGWEARAERIEVAFTIPGLFSKRVGLITVEGLDTVIDLTPPPVPVESSSLPGPPLPSGQTPWLSLLGSYFAEGEVFFPETAVRVRRGKAEEAFIVNGFLHLDGPLEFFADGTGPADLALMAEGTFQAAAGAAEVHWNGEADAPVALLDAFCPGWKPDGAMVDLAPSTFEGILLFEQDAPRLASFRASSELIGAKFHSWEAGPASLAVDSEDGTSFGLTTSPLELGAAPWFAARGACVARIEPLPDATGFSLSGELNLESATLDHVPMDAVTVRFSGSATELNLQAGRMTFPDRTECAIGNLRVDVTGLRSPHPTAEGEARLEVRAPGWRPSGSADPGIPFLLPLTFGSAWEDDQPIFRGRLELAGPDGGPIRATSADGEWNLHAAGSIEAEGAPRLAEAIRWQVRAACPLVEWTRGESSLVTVKEFAMTGGWSRASGELIGGGLCNGTPFPARVTRDSATGVPPEVSLAVIHVGPIRLDRETWPGELVAAWREAELSGELLLNGAVSLSTADLAIRLRGGELVYPDGQTIASGVHAETRLLSLFPPAHAPGTNLAIDRMRSRGRDLLTAVRTSLTLAPDGVVGIESFTGSLFGGLIDLEQPAAIRKVGTSDLIAFRLGGLQAREIVPHFPGFGGQIEAALSGRISLEIRDGTVFPLPGTLTLDEGAPARFRLGSGDPFASPRAAPPAGRRHPFNQSVERALEDLTVESLEVSLFDPADPIHPALIRISGTGPDESGLVPVSLDFPVADEEGIIQSLLTAIVGGGIPVASD